MYNSCSCDSRANTVTFEQGFQNKNWPLTFVTSPNAFLFADGRIIDPGEDARFTPTDCEVGFSELTPAF